MTIVARFQNSSLLVNPSDESWVNSCFAHVDGDEQFNSLLTRPLAYYEDDEDDDDGLDYWRPYSVQDGILVIPVRGMLINDFEFAFGSWVTGYDYIANTFNRGLADPKVKGIAFKIDSPGGEVAGNFDLVDMLHAARGQKPVKAFVEEGYSAAYNIAAAADSITVSRTGGVGSVGVVTAHYDISEHMKERGVKITFIHAGQHKVDGNPYEPLPDDVRARIQARMDDLYGMFTASVARNRGMSEQSVRETEALTYSPRDALAVGFADQIGSFDQGLSDFQRSFTGGIHMSADNKTPTFTLTDIDAARAEAVDAGRKEGAAAERVRIAAIIGLEAAEGRTATAMALALETDMSVEAAGKLLARLPEEAKPVATKGGGVANFAKAMSKDNPDIGAEEDEDPTPASASKSRIDRVLAARGR